MKGFAVAVLVLGFVTAAMGQQQQKTVEQLKVEQATIAAQLEMAEAKQPGALVSKFAGFGKELGEAFNGFVTAMDGGMKVTTERVNEFAQTDVGKFAMIALAWKIFSADVWRCVDIGIGFIFLALFVYLVLKAIEVFFLGRMIVTKREGPWYNRNVTKTRSVPLCGNGDASEIEWAVSIIGFLLAGGATFTSAIQFMLP